MREDRGKPNTPNGGIIRTRQYITTYNSLGWNDDDEAKRSEREQTGEMESKTARKKKNITSPRLLDCLFAIADVALLPCTNRNVCIIKKSFPPPFCGSRTTPPTLSHFPGILLKRFCSIQLYLSRTRHRGVHKSIHPYTANAFSLWQPRFGLKFSIAAD